MRFEEKLKKHTPEELWQEYCGFLDLSMDEYMHIQYRLLSEQIQLMSRCELGKRLFPNGVPETVAEFRRNVPLTTFDDYADILLPRKADLLPSPPAIWLETTWEGGEKPFKTAPYTEGMLEVYRNNILGAMILSTADEKYHFKIRHAAKVLFSLAPLPYASGLFPELVREEVDIRFLPPYNKAKKMSFSQKCKEGFKMSLKGGMNQFYGMTSIVYNISKSFDFSSGKGGLKGLLGIRPNMLYRLLKAKYQSSRDGVPMKPGDLFKLDGFVCVGTDTALYKDELEQLWGRRPLEVAGGTETCLLGTETWKKNGLVFYPDNCFYEFIPEEEMLRSISDPSYIPATYLMDELSAGEKYELVITVFKGGAFIRYRVGDVYRCLRLKNRQEGLDIPQFEYVDRVPNVIDIAGFTRITEKEINHVVDISGLRIHDWIALKEYNDQNHAYLHLYAELPEEMVKRGVVSAELIKEHLSVYFRYHDSDYHDLKRLIGMDPLQVTVLRTGCIEEFCKKTGRTLPKIGARRQDVVDLLRFCHEGEEKEVVTL